MLLALPRFAVIQSTVGQTHNLRYIHEDEDLHGFLQFSGEEIVSPYAKLEIERARSTAGNNNGFVHIRCCYNNKYWVCNSNSFIIAGTDEPNEDQSQWSCTLFEPIRVDVDGEGRRSTGSTNTPVHVRFRHVSLGTYLRSLMTGDRYNACLSVNYDGPDLVDGGQRTSPPARLDVFGIIDWESLLILPKHIALKGDNGLYLSARQFKLHKYLQFASSDIGDPTVGNEVFITKDGSVRIKNNYFGKFWRRSRSRKWIWADSNDTTANNLNTLFYPVKVADNVIALRNLGDNNFCNSQNNDNNRHRNCLKAAVTTLSREARFVVEELVVSRKIYNVHFRLLDARIYNQNIITMVTETTTNNTQAQHSATLRLMCKETRSSTWKGSVSLKLGVKIDIKAGIPLIANNEVQVQTEFAGSYEWCKTMVTENQVETQYTIHVPAMSKITVSLRATQGSCDVPYSYTQCDTLMNGKQVIQNLDDGIYTGINSFNFFYDTKEEEL